MYIFCLHQSKEKLNVISWLVLMTILYNAIYNDRSKPNCNAPLQLVATILDMFVNLLCLSGGIHSHMYYSLLLQLNIYIFAYKYHINDKYMRIDIYLIFKCAPLIVILSLPHTYSLDAVAIAPKRAHKFTPYSSL